MVLQIGVYMFFEAPLRWLRWQSSTECSEQTTAEQDPNQSTTLGCICACSSSRLRHAFMPVA